VLNFLSFFIDFSFTYPVKIKDIKPGMTLGERLIKQKDKYVKKPFRLLTPVDLLTSLKDSFSQSQQNLTDSTVKELKDLHEKNKLGFDTLDITKKMPLAPFMFFGVLLTYFLQGSLFYYIQLLL